MGLKDKAARTIYARDYARKRRLAIATERMRARAERIAKRETPAPLECAWAAGHFEGEGTVTLTKGGRVMHVRPLVSLSSTDPSVIDFFMQRWPGGRRSFMPNSVSGNVRMAHTWALNSGERIERFLLDVRPYIRTARVLRKIDIVIEDILDRGMYQQQPESRARSEGRRLLVRKLNAKGRDSVPMTDSIEAMETA